MLSLTKGSLRKMLDGGNVSDPVLQILQMKNIQNNMDGMTRYKVTLYDGEMQHTFGILATQKNSLVENNELKIGSVIKLEEYAANVLSKDPPKVVVILLNFEILGEMDPKVQDHDVPQQQTAAAAAKKPVQNNENIEPVKQPEMAKAGQNNAKNFYNNKEQQPAQKPALSSNNAASNGSGGAGAVNGMFNNFKVFGISSLNPYQNKWSIKVRVINKSSIRTWSNARGEGRLFSVDLLDQTGEIRANGFNEQCDKFYDLLAIDNVYYISRGQLKTANKQYSTLNNDYEMTFNNETVIEPCLEADNLPHITLNLVQLAELTNKNANDIVDIIGVVKSAGDVATIVSKATQKELRKRDLHLVDDSNCQVNVTLWGKQAEEFDASENPVVLFKGAKLSDYGGRSLSVLGSTVIQVNPDIPEAHKVRGWFDQGDHMQCQDLSNQNGSGGSQNGAGGAGGSMQGSMNNWKTFDMVKDEKMGLGDKADYFSAKGIVLYAKKDNSMYMACSGENCNKKVVDQNDGSYRCEKCSKTYQDFKWRMILNINVADFSDYQWATCFQETAETILGVKTEVLGGLKASDPTAYDQYFSDCVFKEFNFKMRAKMETYNDERRVKLSVVNIEPIDYCASARRLLANLKAFAKQNK